MAKDSKPLDSKWKDGVIMIDPALAGQPVLDDYGNDTGEKTGGEVFVPLKAGQAHIDKLIAKGWTKKCDSPKGQPGA
jgi:hypothetical protein